MKLMNDGIADSRENHDFDFSKGCGVRDLLEKTALLKLRTIGSDLVKRLTDL